ncbi:MAG: RNA 2',3'-cyclic phosphodiesterase [Bacteroidia bacterium]|nr:RNA 2',3'-cyclic phosphodiesterase [Bacteroidia bacterium]
MKRIFLALPLEPVGPVIEKIKQLQKLLHDYSIKWVSIENFHLTLFFFGEIPVQQIPVIKELLGSSFKNSSAFTFSLTGPGIFKKGKEPRVLWFGIKATDQLFEIKKDIDKAVATLGFIPDNIVFRPHVTLGRFLPRQEVSSVLDNALKDEQLREPFLYSASKLILFESKLFPTGPQYYPVEVFPLMTSSKSY